MQENELRQLTDDLESMSNPELSERLRNLPAADIAEILNEQDEGVQVVRAFKLLNKDLAAEVFAHLDALMQERLLLTFSDKEVAALVDELFTDDAVEVLAEMPANIVKKILKNTDEQTRLVLNEFLNYPEESAGRAMTNEFMSLKSEMTVKEAFAKIKKAADDTELVYTCFVTDSNRVLKGIVSVKTLLISELNNTLQNIMETDFIYAKTHDNREQCARRMRKYGLISMPVVDLEQRLVGILTVDDILDVMEEEYTEDIQKMSALLPSEQSYSQMSIFALVKQRIGWLMFLMISAFLTAIIISNFEDKLSVCIILIYSMPLLMDTGGNTGAQASTLAIRGLIIGELESKNLPKVIVKEILIGIIVSAILLPLPFLRVYFASSGVGITSFQILMVTLSVCLSLVVVTILSQVIGAALPFVAKKLKLDPAIMAAPLVATIMDSLTLLVYFALSGLFVFTIGGVGV